MGGLRRGVMAGCPVSRMAGKEWVKRWRWTKKRRSTVESWAAARLQTIQRVVAFTGQSFAFAAGCAQGTVEKPDAFGGVEQVVVFLTESHQLLTEGHDGLARFEFGQALVQVTIQFGQTLVFVGQFDDLAGAQRCCPLLHPACLAQGQLERSQSRRVASSISALSHNWSSRRAAGSAECWQPVS